MAGPDLRCYTAPMRASTTVIAFLFVLSVTGVALPGFGDAVAAGDDAAEAKRLRGEITEAIGDARCRNLVNCRVVGLGARPCGGPEEYVAYSIWDTDREHIDNLVFEYNLLSEDLMLESDMAGACVVIPKPGVDCIHDRCVTIPGTN